MTRTTRHSDPRSVDVRDRVLALADSPEAGRRLSTGLVEAADGLDIWVWGPRHQEDLDEWRRLPFEPLTARYAIDDLLVHAALAQSWDAVETCVAAIVAIKTRSVDALGAWTRSSDAAWSASDFTSPFSPEEARAIATCANAWNERARRLRRARQTDPAER
jgi:hypothetical protein